MIITKKEHLSHYLGIHKNLDTAIEYILNNDLTTIPTGSTPIDNKMVYVNHFSYSTAPIGEGFIEAHRDYLDIHITLTGEEYIGYLDMKDVQELQPYNEEDDFYKVTGRIETFAYMMPGNIIMTWPEDAHQPKIQVSDSEHVDKLVFKVYMK
ncbi:MAG: YhcH/YjgK/YiaL family protein [Coprobacillus sp.]